MIPLWTRPESTCVKGIIPKFFIEIAKSLEIKEADARKLLIKVSEQVAVTAEKGLEEASVRYAVRKLDAHLKKIAPSSRKIEELTERFNAAVSDVDPSKWAEIYKSDLRSYIEKKDISNIIRIYDDKGLVDIASKCLGISNRKALSEYVGRMLSTKRGTAALGALRRALPTLP